MAESALIYILAESVIFCPNQSLMLGRTVQPIRTTKRRFAQNILAESSDILISYVLICLVILDSINVVLNTRTIAVKVVLSAKVYYLGIKTKVFYQMRLIKTVQN